MPFSVPLKPASTEFRKIPRKHRNSVEMGKFHSSDRNSMCREKRSSLGITTNAADPRIQRGLQAYGGPNYFFFTEHFSCRCVQQ